jgi:hypothetical protein
VRTCALCALPALGREACCIMHAPVMEAHDALLAATASPGLPGRSNGPFLNWHGLFLQCSPDGDVLYANVDDSIDFAQRHGFPITHARALAVATEAMTRGARDLVAEFERALPEWAAEERADRIADRDDDIRGQGGRY